MIKPLSLFFILFLIDPGNLISQNQPQPIGTESSISQLCNEALSLFIKDTIWGQTIGNSMIVDASMIPSYDLPDSINGIHILPLFKTSKKGKIKMVKIFPLSFYKDYFFINVVRYDVELHRRKTMFFYDGGISIHYSYDCDSHKFLLSSVVYIGG